MSVLHKHGIERTTARYWRNKSGRQPIAELVEHERKSARRHFPTEKKHAILDEIEAAVAGGGNQKEVLEKHGLYSKGVRRWRTALGRIPLSDLKKRHKTAQFLDRKRERKVGLDAFIARTRKKAVKLHKAFVVADTSTLKGAMTKVNSAEDISKILADLNEYKETEELDGIQLEAVGIAFEQVAAIREKMLG